MSTEISSSGTIEVRREPKGLVRMVFAGVLDRSVCEVQWGLVSDALERREVRSLELDGEALTSCDGAGLALLHVLESRASRRGLELVWRNRPESVEKALAAFSSEEKGSVDGGRGDGFVAGVGLSVAIFFTAIRDQIAFLGELSVALFRLVGRGSSMRWVDFWLVTEQAGVKGLPIIALLGFLVGLIMAFQGAVTMSMFGAEIYIADFVGLSVLRELGPLITGIVLAGRTGSAFAAELGTMKVNEEIDALTTMGLDPVRFLVLPRVLAASFVTPLLALFANLCGLVGGAVVMLGLGFPLVTFVNRVTQAVSGGDLVSGLVKALVFGVLVAASGCLSGLRTGEGASAVGDAATRAVVSAIVMIVVADGLFAVLFHLLGV
jgi:phospholipid/cholesterol/gamma-HCH transport system permease protein